MSLPNGRYGVGSARPRVQGSTRKGGDLKVADFGIARIADASTASGTFRGWGSLIYMPPEGWQGDEGPRPTPAYDLYSLGVLAYEIVPQRLSAHVVVEIQPRYTIKNGGTHGNSEAGTDFGINPKSSYTWYGNAGSPAGVAKDAPISKCAPQLTNVGPG